MCYKEEENSDSSLSGFEEEGEESLIKPNLNPEDWEIIKETSKIPLPFHEPKIKLNFPGQKRPWFEVTIKFWINDESRDQLLLLQGPSGTGKRTLISNFIKNNSEYLGAIHYCDSMNMSTLEPGDFVYSIALQLIHNIPEFRKKIESNDKLISSLNIENCRLNPINVFSSIIISNLQDLELEKPKLILIGNIDQSKLIIQTKKYSSTISDCIIPIIGLLPSNISLIITSDISDESEFNNLLQKKIILGVKKISIECPEAKNDIKEFFNEKTLEVCKENLLCANLYQMDLSFNDTDTGIDGLILFILNKIFKNDSKKFHKEISPVLGILLALFEPLTIKQLSFFIPEISEIKGPFWDIFCKIDNGENYLILSHEYYRFFFMSSKSKSYQINVIPFHKQITEIILKRRYFASTSISYELKYLFLHLFIIKDTDNLLKIVFNIKWLQEKIQICGIRHLLRDIDMLSELNDLDIKILQKTLEDSSYALTIDPSPIQLCQQLMLRIDLSIFSIKIWRLLQLSRSPKSDFWFGALVPTLSIKPSTELIEPRTYIKLTSSIHILGFDNPKDPTLLNRISTSNTTTTNFLDNQSSLQSTTRPSWIEAISISPDQSIVCSSWSSYDIEVWDLNYPGNILKTLEGHLLDIKDISISNDCKTAMSVGDDRIIHIWNLEKGISEYSWEAHQDPGECCKISPNGKFVISAGLDKVISIWSFKSWKLKNYLFGHTNFVVSLDISPDSSLIVSASWDKTLRIWDYKKFECKNILNGHSNWVTSVAFSRNGDYIISGSADTTLRVWKTEDGSEYRILNGHTHCVESISIDSSPKSLKTEFLCISCSHDKTVRLWNFHEGICLALIVFDSFISSVSWTGSYVCCGDAMSQVHFLQLIAPKHHPFIKKEGFLFIKLDSRNVFKKRWVILGNQKIEFFTSSKKKLLGFIQIINSKVKKNNTMRKEFCFEIHSDDSIKWYLAANTRTDMLSWMLSISYNSESLF